MHQFKEEDYNYINKCQQNWPETPDSIQHSSGFEAYLSYLILFYKWDDNSPSDNKSRMLVTANLPHFPFPTRNISYKTISAYCFNLNAISSSSFIISHLRHAVTQSPANTNHHMGPLTCAQETVAIYKWGERVSQ